MIGLMETSKTEWDQRFIILAHEVATWSKDTDGTGCVIVTSDRRQWQAGYNGFARGIADMKQRYTDEQIRQKLMIHAERNALDFALFDTTGCTAYVTRHPCSDCANGLIQKGIVRVVCPPSKPESKWAESHKLALNLLQEAGVQVDHYESQVA